MYWDIEGLACVFRHRSRVWRVYWDIECLACVLGFGVCIRT